MKKFLILAVLLQFFCACETTENVSETVSEQPGESTTTAESDVIIARDAVVDMRQKCIADGIPEENETDWQSAEEDFLIGEDYYEKKAYDDAIIFYEKAYDGYNALYSSLVEGNLHEQLLEVTALRDRINMLEFADFDRNAYDSGVQSLDIASKAIAEGADEDSTKSGEVSAHLIEAKNSFLTVLNAGFHCRATNAKSAAEEAANEAINEKADATAPTEYEDALRAFDAGVMCLQSGKSEEAAGNFEIATSLYKKSVETTKKIRQEVADAIETMKQRLRESLKKAEEADKLLASEENL